MFVGKTYTKSVKLIFSGLDFTTCMSNENNFLEQNNMYTPNNIPKVLENVL